ncbi:MAG TPA: Ig-like domain repeat protein [Terriglobales bacterium]|jgi:photosystem II stability/assembly factor-like uncharacterized protein|nr:Ig-like domain repeat protein [Terriglobales bacterium]
MKSHCLFGLVVVSFIALNLLAFCTVCGAAQGKTAHYVSGRTPVQGPGHEIAVDLPAEVKPTSAAAPIELSSSVNNWRYIGYLSSAIIRDISFPTPLIGYAVSENGQVWKTIDGGVSWTEIMNLGFPYEWEGIQALNANDVIISGFIDSFTPARGIIRWSHDGGASWTGDIRLTSTGWLYRVRYSDNLNGLAFESPTAQGAPPNAAHYTSDGGQTAPDWTADTIDPNGSWFGNQFSLLPNGHARASGISYCDSTNGGVNWSCRRHIDPVFDGETFFVDDLNGWVAGGEISPNVEGWVHRTTDGGATWSDRTLDSPWPIREIRFLNPQLGWAAGGNIFSGVGGIYFSNDGGQSWSLDVDTGHEMDACDTKFTSLSNYQVWCAGYNNSGSVVYRLRVGNEVGTTLFSSTNPAKVGQPVTLQAVIAGPPTPIGFPTGTVDFRDGNTTIASGVPLDIYGNATYTTAFASSGIHSITVAYSGDLNYLPAVSQPFNQNVTAAATSTSVSSSINPSTFGQQITFTATVSTLAPGSGTPTGAVQFYDGGATLGAPVALTGGTASYASSLLLPGQHSIAAVHIGDANFLGSTSSPFTQTVNKAPAAVMVVTNANPSQMGQSVGFTATVSALVGGVPTGTVDFKDGNTTLTTGQALDGSGTASFLTTTLTAGAHSITAVYSGDSLYASSTSPVLTQVINNPGDTGTSSAITLVVTPLHPGQQNSIERGQNATLTATVSPSPGTNGTVVFRDGTNVLGTVPVTASLATLNLTTPLSVGQHTIQAIYSGGGGFQGNLSTPLTVLHSPRPR